MDIIAWVILYVLCRQIIADRTDASKNQYGQEIAFQIGPPILEVTTSSPPPNTTLASAVESKPISTNVTDPDLQVVAVDGSSIFLLPCNNATTTAASGMDQPSRPLLMAYYPDWVEEEFPPEKIDFSRYDWLDFAFAVPDSEFRLAWDDEEAPTLLSRLVTSAHAAGAKVKLSVGGWTGSRYFSPAVATAESRKIFANSILSAYDLYDLDGIDIDWEYPGHEGNEGNLYSPADTANFLAFLKVLRVTLPPTAKISAAVQTLPFLGESGDPVSDTSEFGVIFDWILIMNYDTWESTSPPGPNAPLYDACGNSTQPASSASASVISWVQSGFPVSKLVLGLPSYGYIQKSASERLRTRWIPSRGHHHWHDHENNEKHHDHETENESLEQDEHGYWGGGGSDYDNDDPNRGDDGDGDDGDGDQAIQPPLSPDPEVPRPITFDDSDNQVQFRALVKQGALILTTANGTVQYVAGGGFERQWDFCSETPFLRSTSSGQIITYDDTESLALKARFAKEVGMLGINVFDVHGDTDEHHLIDAIRGAMGL